MITTQRCGCQGFNELRVAFGDMKNCQLNCPFCFTREQKQAYDHLSFLNQHSLDSVRIIRFTGGEPLMSQAQIRGIIRELSRIQEQELESLDLIVIQTNGLDVATKDLTEFGNLSLPLLFEISFKGTNVDEYRWLIFERAINIREAESFLKKQFEGYMHLVKTFKDKENALVLARLGIFHSSLNKPTFKFVYPNDKKRLMFNPADWSPHILEVYQNQKGIWDETFDGKMVIEKIKTPADGSPGIGKRYRRVIEHLKSKNLLVEEVTKIPLPKVFKEKYFYKRGNEVYESAQRLLKIHAPRF